MKRKKLRNLIACALSCTILLSSGMGVNANPYFTEKCPTNESFSEEWERTVNIYYRNTNAIVGTMIYGYDRNFVNEDYVWTQSLSYNAQAILKKDGNTYRGLWKKGSLAGYSNVEKWHTDNDPKFIIKFQTNLAKSTFKKAKEFRSYEKNKEK